MTAYMPSELIGILMDIDEEAVLELGTSRRYSIVIVGGSALMLSRLTSRNATHDIDYLRADSALSGILDRHHQLSSQVQVYADRLPQGFEGRLVRIPLDTEAIDYLCPSAEDLAVMKLYSWREQDQLDLLSTEMLKELDMDLLDRIVHSENEAKAAALTPLLYRQMVETFDKEFKPRAEKRIRKLSKHWRLG